jgi:RimJ/RimL family protein N-acetyltransferase
MTRITSPRLILEALRESHAEDLWCVLADPRIYRFLDDKPPASLSALAERFRKLERGRSVDDDEIWLNWTVQTTEGRCIGFVQATIYPDRSAAVAFVVGANYWGKGYGREATEAMLRSLVESCSIRGAFATVDPRNVASQNLLLSLGFGKVSANEFPLAEIRPGDLLLGKASLD